MYTGRHFVATGQKQTCYVNSNTTTPLIKVAMEINL